jgi:hypothetical protein
MDPKFHPPGWIKPFDEIYLTDCKALNVFAENFPERFNPNSVLLLDMFHTSEDKLQDLLTKTMVS